MLEKLPDAVGHLLHNTRAGLEKTAYHLIDLRGGTAAISVTSTAFVDHGPLPARCTVDGPGVSPPLAWHGVPAAAASVVLIAEDADSPTPQPLVHAIVVGLTGGDGGLAEGTIDADAPALIGAALGRNSLLKRGWLPPDPPPGHGLHRYVFQVFALDAGVSFGDAPGREAVLDALREHAIASGCLTATYERPDGSVSERSATAPVGLQAPG